MTKKKPQKSKPTLAELYRMPKEELKKLAKATVEKAERENYELVSLSKKLYLTAWVLLAITILLFGILGMQFSSQSQAITNTPASSGETELPAWVALLLVSPVILLSVSLASLIFTIPFFWGIRSNPRGLILDPLAIPRMRKSMAIVSMIAIVPLTATLLTLVGFVNIVFEFLKNVVLPGLTNLVNMILANLVSWILSGVIGNFIYDLLKKIVSREKQRLEKNAK